MGIALEIFRHCDEQATAHGAHQITSVRIAVGELSTVEPELLKFAWEAVVADSPHHEAKLEVDWHPCRQFCSNCNQTVERREGSWLRLCPTCDLPLEVSGGTELDILEVSLEIEDDEEDCA